MTINQKIAQMEAEIKLFNWLLGIAILKGRTELVMKYSSAVGELYLMKLELEETFYA